MPAEPRLIPLAGVAPTLPERPIVFERIAVVGLGLIGGSIALAARQVWPGGLVIGVDRNDVLEDAVARHAVDVAASDLTIVSEADLVILAAPILDNIRLLGDLPHYLDRPAIVTDVGSTKRRTVEAARLLPDRLHFVGGHPLAGSTRRALAGARPDLFVGRPWLFTPDPQTPQSVFSRNAQNAPNTDLQKAENPRKADPQNSEHTQNVDPQNSQNTQNADNTRNAQDHHPAASPLERLLAFAEGLGAVPRALDPDAHDHLVAFVSHLPQLSATALMRVVGEAVGQEGLSLSGRGLQDTTRLAGSPADIWEDICRTNADEIRPAIDALIDALQGLRGALTSADSVEQAFESANRWRSVLEDLK